MPTDTPPGNDDADLLERWEATLPHQQPLGRALLDRYREPHRRYHTTDHLRSVLQRIDDFADDQDLFLVRLAAWFHDAVYAVPAGQVTNEEASARLSVRELGRAGLEQEDLTQVARLVRLTATHLPGSRDPEGELLCDADLAVLASSDHDYAAYVAAVRAEYAAVPDQQFWAGRREVLAELAQRDLFRTGKARRLNAAARANLLGELAILDDLLGEPVEGSRL